MNFDDLNIEISPDLRAEIQRVEAKEVELFSAEPQDRQAVEQLLHEFEAYLVQLSPSRRWEVTGRLSGFLPAALSVLVNPLILPDHLRQFAASRNGAALPGQPGFWRTVWLSELENLVRTKRAELFQAATTATPG
jgi:hypothetical protein